MTLLNLKTYYKEETNDKPQQKIPRMDPPTSLTTPKIPKERYVGPVTCPTK